jgi:hypothetical protein
MGQTYTNNRIAPGAEVGGSGASKVIARYPIGSQTTVYYNPQKPSESFLEHKAPSLVALWIAVAIVNLTMCMTVVPLFIFTR